MKHGPTTLFSYFLFLQQLILGQVKFLLTLFLVQLFLLTKAMRHKTQYIDTHLHVDI